MNGVGRREEQQRRGAEERRDTDVVSSNRSKSSQADSLISLLFVLPSRFLLQICRAQSILFPGNFQQRRIKLHERRIYGAVLFVARITTHSRGNSFAVTPSSALKAAHFPGNWASSFTCTARPITFSVWKCTFGCMRHHRNDLCIFQDSGSGPGGRRFQILFSRPFFSR